MSILDRFSSAVTAAKKAWQDPAVEAKVKVGAVPAPDSTMPQPTTNIYSDTISKATDDLPVISAEPRNRIEIHLDDLSNQVENELKNEDRDFEKLQAVIYNMIMLMMRRSATFDIENMREIRIKITKSAEDIQKTYNTWQGLTLTSISATVSIGAGFAGLSPLFPASVVSGATAAALSASATPLSSSGTAFSGIGSIFDRKSEGNRQVIQVYLKRSQDTEEERRSSKQGKNEHVKTANAALKEFNNQRHEARRTMTA